MRGADPAGKGLALGHASLAIVCALAIVATALVRLKPHAESPVAIAVKRIRATPVPTNPPDGVLLFSLAQVKTAMVTKNGRANEEFLQRRPSLMAVRADGSALHRVRGALMTHSATWSPDGHSVAFISTTDKMLWVASADGSRAHKLTTATGVEDDSPSWSPDGRQIVFARRPTGRGGGYFLGDRDNTYVPGTGAGQNSLFIVDVATQQTRLLAAPWGEVNISTEWEDPVWSPDGRLIAAWLRTSQGPPEVFLLSPEDGSIRRLTTGPDEWPRWSPDGTRIAVTHYDGATDRGILSLVDVRTGHRVNVTGPLVRAAPRPPRCGFASSGGAPSVSDDEPRWSPDGRRIAFLTNRFRINTDDQVELAVVDVQTLHVSKAFAPPPQVCPSQVGLKETELNLLDWVPFVPP